MAASKQSGQGQETSNQSGQEQERQGSRMVEQRQGGRSSIPSVWGLSPQEMWLASPFELMRRMTEDMDRLFGMSPWSGTSTATARLWSPPVEVAERDGSLVVCAELPGLGKEDVKVELTPDGLLIQGERKEEHEERQKGVLRSERRFGRFSRLIPLPETVNLEQAKARFNNGLLEITIPIPEERRQRREIAIETSQGGEGGKASKAA